MRKYVKVGIIVGVFSLLIAGYSCWCNPASWMGLFN